MPVCTVAVYACAGPVLECFSTPSKTSVDTVGGECKEEEDKAFESVRHPYKENNFENPEQS